MGNEAFEELEEPEQFEDLDLKLPEGLTREGLWEEMRIAEQGNEEGGIMEHQDLQEIVMPHPRYCSYVYPNGLGMNGMEASGIGTNNGFLPATMNGFGVPTSVPIGLGVNGFVGDVGVNGALGNGSPKPDLAIYPSALLPHGGDTSSSDSPVSPEANGAGHSSASASASQLSPLIIYESFNDSGLVNGTVDFDIKDYLHFEDDDAIKIEDEDIYIDKTE